jgi:hypothetical protein
MTSKVKIKFRKKNVQHLKIELKNKKKYFINKKTRNIFSQQFSISTEIQIYEG